MVSVSSQHTPDADPRLAPDQSSSDSDQGWLIWGAWRDDHWRDDHVEEFGRAL